MYTVLDANNSVVAICSRLEDAQAWLSTKLDKINYTVVGQNNFKINEKKG